MKVVLVSGISNVSCSCIFILRSNTIYFNSLYGKLCYKLCTQQIIIKLIFLFPAQCLKSYLMARKFNLKLR